MAPLVALYRRRSDRINNWDLVDLSAGHILGRGVALMDQEPDLLERLAASDNLLGAAQGDRRHFRLPASLRAPPQRPPTLAIAERLMADAEDLIHKAAGWLLREAGKRNRAALDAFLDRHHRTMPRTMLRYAIEQHPEPQRRAYLRGKP